MSRMPARLAFCGALALLGLAGAGFAHASTRALHDVENVTLVGSAAPSLLGPIDALGRNGWACAPERAAREKRPREADLPASEGR